MKWAGRERQWGEDVAEADERDSGAGSEGSDGKMNAWGGGRGRQWRWRQQGKLVSLCFYESIILFK